MNAASPLLQVTVGVILLLVIAPLVVPLMMSISDTAYIVFPPRGFTLKWYGEVLANPEARGSFLFSLQLAAIVTAVSLALGVPCAAGLTRYRLPGSDAVLGLVLSPLIVPLIVTGVALLQFFSMLGSRATFMQLIVGHTVVCLPYVVRSVSASFVLVDRNLEDAASVLGAPPHVVATQGDLAAGPPRHPGRLRCSRSSSRSTTTRSRCGLPTATTSRCRSTSTAVIERSFDPSIAAISSLMILFALLLVLVIEKVFGISLARLAT